jgi:hypothetical protein
MDNKAGLLLIVDNPGEVVPAFRVLAKINFSNNDLPAAC